MKHAAKTELTFLAQPVSRKLLNIPKWNTGIIDSTIKN